MEMSTILLRPFTYFIFQLVFYIAVIIKLSTSALHLFSHLPHTLQYVIECISGCTNFIKCVFVCALKRQNMCVWKIQSYFLISTEDLYDFIFGLSQIIFIHVHTIALIYYIKNLVSVYNFLDLFVLIYYLHK